MKVYKLVFVLDVLIMLYVVYKCIYFYWWIIIKKYKKYLGIYVKFYWWKFIVNEVLFFFLFYILDNSKIYGLECIKMDIKLFLVIYLNIWLLELYI